MISIDTNVLLRRILQDDVEQQKKADRLFDSGKTILVTDIVLVETIWTLKGKLYGVDRDGIIAVITSLLQEPRVVFESLQAVWSALNEYIAAPAVSTSNGARFADFSDALIAYKSHYAALASGDALDVVYTFDQAALYLPGTRKP